ncbi:MAG: STAS domain-containing protein [Planctomycetota bacterium]|jgi:anti-anti-sigma factor
MNNGPTDDALSLFARTSRNGQDLRIHITCPSIAQRESEIISQMVRDAVNDADPAPRFVVLDFSDVTFVTSTGIGACVEIHNSANALGAKVVLYKLRPELDAVFRATRMDKLFKLIGDEKKLDKLLR